MKIPFSWLQEHSTSAAQPEHIAQTLTMLGLEAEISHFEEEPIIELSLTPNLIHAASVRGTARELAAGERTSLLPFIVSLQEKSTKMCTEVVSISVDDQKNCPRYSCRVIENIKVAPSPLWLQKRIEAAGMRSVNNVVDITNYVMLELGQPLHAFDLAAIEEGKLFIRKATHGESIQTIDEQHHLLTEEILIIASKTKPLAIAGVMGSLESEVTEQTTTILLESAYFYPAQVRRSAKATGIQSAASYRFERGCDPNGTRLALDRAAELIQSHCQGQVLSGLYDTHEDPFVCPLITLRIARVPKLLGISLSINQIEAILTSLELLVVGRTSDSLTLQPPSYRHDLKQEIDLIEEIARLYGYHNLIPKQKQMWRKGELGSSATYLFETKVRSFLLKCNLQEVITCDLISPAEAEFVTEDMMAKRSQVRLLNPASLDHAILRPSLLPGLLATYKLNYDHEVNSIALFEVGRIHFKEDKNYIEPSVAAIFLGGSAALPHWQNKEREVDFFDIKGIVEALLTNIETRTLDFQPSHFKNLHPTRQAYIICGDRHVGVMGEVHPLILKKLAIPKRAYFAEINLEDLRLHAHEHHKMVSLPLYPSSTRDWTLSLSKEIAISEIFSLIKKANSSLLESVFLVDIYENEKLGTGVIHATFRLCYRDLQQTIEMREVEKEHVMIMQSVLSALKKGTS